MVEAAERRSASPPADRAILEQGPWLDVDLAALQRNARAFAARVRVRLLPMVKANGYGLGAVPVARALEALGPWGFGVATLAEARTLRDAGITRPIVAFVPLVPDDIPGYVGLGIRPAIGSPASLAAWLEATTAPFHLAIDTGMARNGFVWHDGAALEMARAVLAGAAGYEGAFTHCHSSDGPIEVTELQWDRFQGALNALGGRPPLVHAANSAAAQWEDRFAGTLARPGIFLYGGRAGPLEPEPVARLEARVAAVRPIRAGDSVSYGGGFRVRADAEVATLGIGYADGLPRSLGRRGQVRLGGTLCPVAGAVTMDMTMALVRPGSVRVGDRATVFGPGLSLDQQAKAAGTISYELLAGVGPRVIRRYVG